MTTETDTVETWNVHDTHQRRRKQSKLHRIPLGDDLAFEAGLHIERHNVELVHVVHHIDKAGDRPRMGLFFRARAWSGEPELREPEKCTQWAFWDPNALPDDLVPYTRVAIGKIQNGELYSETGRPA
ncbi:hypothetical protein [Streptomyces sp. 1268]|uniref:hypothetical protein n=1 Tax=Streptomyces sp. 1268 TaxID=3231942 RepID=UPI0038D464C8